MRVAYRHFPDRQARDHEIRRLAAEGVSKSEIARRVDLSRMQVREILRPDLHEAENARRAAHARRRRDPDYPKTETPEARLERLREAGRRGGAATAAQRSA